MNPLHGKTALITGASSGLGVAFAHRLAARGASLILVARREDKLREVQQTIQEKYGVPVEIVTMDLAAPDAPQRLYDQLKASGKTVEVLINNAGLGLFGKFVDIPWEREHAMLELDMITLVHLTKLFVKDMVDRRSGWVLHVASTGAYQPSPLYASYSAAKSFVLSFGEALHFELRDTGVHSTVLSPGVTRTEFHEVAGQDYRLYHRLTAMDSDKVAEIGLRALLKNRPSIVAGWMNAAAARLMQVMPRRLSTWMAYYMMR
jgi:short-subunit dehydrogenase